MPTEREGFEWTGDTPSPFPHVPVWKVGDRVQIAHKDGTASRVGTVVWCKATGLEQHHSYIRVEWDEAYRHGGRITIPKESRVPPNVLAYHE